MTKEDVDEVEMIKEDDPDMYFRKIKEMGLSMKQAGAIQVKTPEMAKETKTGKDREEEEELKEGFAKEMDKA